MWRALAAQGLSFYQKHHQLFTTRTNSQSVMRAKGHTGVNQANLKRDAPNPGAATLGLEGVLRDGTGWTAHPRQEHAETCMGIPAFSASSGPEKRTRLLRWTRFGFRDGSARRGQRAVGETATGIPGGPRASGPLSCSMRPLRSATIKLELGDLGLNPKLGAVWGWQGSASRHSVC